MPEFVLSFVDQKVRFLVATASHGTSAYRWPFYDTDRPPLAEPGPPTAKPISPSRRPKQYATGNLLFVETVDQPSFSIMPNGDECSRCVKLLARTSRALNESPR